jgi:putative hydrolase of the HAD superfamily
MIGGEVPVRAVLFDLDDTLYPQAEYLGLAWFAVAEQGARLGLDRDRLLAALIAVAARGSDRGGIIDEAVRLTCGDPTGDPLRNPAGEPAAQLVPELVAAFHAVRPSRLTPYPGVPDALRELRGRVPIAVITDGAVAGQRAKLAALGLADAFDAVVLSDSWGRGFRKPHPRPFRAALARLGVTAREAVMIGDRPDKDMAGAAALGIRTIRVHTGEYRSHPDHPATWLRCPTATSAVAALRSDARRESRTGVFP